MRDESLSKWDIFKTDFKQQRLPAQQPEFLRASKFLPAVFITGLIFIILGCIFLNISESVKEIELDYTDCEQYPNTSGKQKCSEVIQQNMHNSCNCRLNFSIEESFNKDVNIYYGLDNFYQNHRRYILSQDRSQLEGNTASSLSWCLPFEKDQGKKIAPCGAVANSMFNDTITLESSLSGEVKFNKKGIAWDSDKQIKFKNPPGSLIPTDEDFAFKNFTKPPAWSKSIWELDITDDNNNGFLNEDFLVWMRTAAFPRFRKLYGKLDHNDSEFQEGLPNGSYSFMINYKFPVDKLHGRKFIVLANTSILGGKNRFIGIAYIVTGVVSIAIGLFLLVVHVKYRMEERDLYIDRYTPW